MGIAKLLAASALLLAGTGAFGAASPDGEARLAKLLKGRTAGEPVDCIYLPSVRETRVISGTAIIYDAGRTIYVNRPAGGARDLSSGDVLVTRPTNTQLCKVDIVNVLDQGTHFWRGFVNLGDFVPYTRGSKSN